MGYGFEYPSKNMFRREKVKKTVAFFLATFFVFMLFPSRANAYLDPGNNSYLFQNLIGGLVVFLFVVKLAWKKVRFYITKLTFSLKTRGNHENNEKPG